MANIVLLVALLSMILLLPCCSHAQVQDFCVADLTRSATPSGYPCKTNVTVEEFYYRGLATPGKFVEPFRAAASLAFVDKFPGLNGLGISASRLDIDVGGVVPLNTKDATEIIFIVKGSVAVAFISSSSNIVYSKTLYEGDIFVFPPVLLHYIYNVGKTRAVVLSAYNKANPGVQVTDFALFGNNLPSTAVQKVTYIDITHVKELKAFFGMRTVV